MSTMTITRTDGLTTEIDGTLSNAALRTLSLDEIRACYVTAQRGRKIAAQYGNTTAVVALDGYLARITLVGAERARRVAEGHNDTGCVCGTYDRCRGIRAASGSWRDMHRAYND